MSDTNRFGKIVTPGMVERAVAGSLDVWINDYLGELERLEEYAPNSIQRPLGVITASEFEKWPEDQLPVVLVINTGLHGAPERHARGVYTAGWMIGIAAIVSDTDQAASRRLAMTYVTAIRAAILQHGKLTSPTFPNGFADYVNWLDETYGDIPFLASRNLAAARTVIEVGVTSVVTMHDGPRTPSVQPSTDPGPWPPAVEENVKVVPISALEAV